MQQHESFEVLRHMDRWNGTDSDADSNADPDADDQGLPPSYLPPPTGVQGPEVLDVEGHHSYQVDNIVYAYNIYLYNPWTSFAGE